MSVQGFDSCRGCGNPFPACMVTEEGCAPGPADYCPSCVRLADGSASAAEVDAWLEGEEKRIRAYAAASSVGRGNLHEPCVCGGTGNHDGQSVSDCDECNPERVAS